MGLINSPGLVALSKWRLLVFGGDSSDRREKRVWLYDFESASWTEKSSMPFRAVDVGAGVVLDDIGQQKVIVVGGYNSANGARYASAIYTVSLDTW